MERKIFFRKGAGQNIDVKISGEEKLNLIKQKTYSPDPEARARRYEEWKNSHKSRQRLPNN